MPQKVNIEMVIPSKHGTISSSVVATRIWIYPHIGYHKEQANGLRRRGIDATNRAIVSPIRGWPIFSPAHSLAVGYPKPPRSNFQFWISADRFWG